MIILRAWRTDHKQWPREEDVWSTSLSMGKAREEVHAKLLCACKIFIMTDSELMTTMVGGCDSEATVVNVGRMHMYPIYKH